MASKYLVTVIMKGGKSVSIPVFADSDREAEYRATSYAKAVHRCEVLRIENTKKLRGY